MPSTPNFSNLRLLALDVDGVLTDGSILLDDHGVETKRFNVRDGQGITAWIKAGYEVAIITKRAGRGADGKGALVHRCRELGIPEHRIVQGCQDKSAALDKLLADTGLSTSQIAYVGDDWPDIPVLKRVGFAVAPADAVDEVKQVAHWLTTRPGGRGAVRETIERILHEKGELRRVLEIFGIGA